MASLFPEELWAYIVDCLHPLEAPHATRCPTAEKMTAISTGSLDDTCNTLRVSLAALSRLSRCSRMLHSIVEPVLYRAYPCNYVVDVRSFLGSLFTGDRTPDLVRHMICNPPLGSSLIGASAYSFIDVLPRLQELLDRSTWLQDSIRMRLKHEMLGGEICAFLELLLLASTRLESLSLMCPRWYSEHFLFNTVRCIVERQSATNLYDASKTLQELPLSKLRTLSISEKKSRVRQYGRFDTSNAVLRIPSLENLSFINVELNCLDYGDETKKTLNIDEHTLPNIKTVTIHPTSTNDMYTVLRLCPNLTSLVVEETEEGSLTMHILGDHLRCFSLHLKHLQIIQHTVPSYVISSQVLNTRDPVPHSLGSLEKLSNLQTLTATSGLLVPYVLPCRHREPELYRRRGNLCDILPRSLREMTVLNSIGEVHGDSNAATSISPRTVLTDLFGRELLKLMSNDEFSKLRMIRFETVHGTINDLTHTSWRSTTVSKGDILLHTYWR